MNNNDTKYTKAKDLALEFYNLIPNLNSVDLEYLLDNHDYLDQDQKPTLRTVVRWLAEFNEQLPREFRGSRNRVKADRIRKKKLLDFIIDRYNYPFRLNVPYEKL